MPSTDEFSTPDGPDARTTRRTVVRGAATAAWAVPAITLMSAAPAVAASGPAAVAVGTFNAQRVNILVDLAGNTLNPCTISNLNTQATTALVVIVEFEPQGAAGDFSTATVNTAPTGWGSPVVTSYGTGNRSRRFTYTAPTQLSGTGTPANASRGFGMNINLTPTGGPGTMRITANPGGSGTQVSPNPRSDTF